jgi:hypothetical protein
MTQLVLSGFPLHTVLTHQIHIDDFQKGFELMESGLCGKVVCSSSRTSSHSVTQAVATARVSAARRPGTLRGTS